MEVDPAKLLVQARSFEVLDVRPERREAAVQMRKGLVL